MRRITLMFAILLVSACNARDFYSVAQPVRGCHHVLWNRRADSGCLRGGALVRRVRWPGPQRWCGLFPCRGDEERREGHYYFPVPEIRSDFTRAHNPWTFVVAYKPGYRWVPEVNGVLTPADELIEDAEGSRKSDSHLTMY